MIKKYSHVFFTICLIIFSSSIYAAKSLIIDTDAAIDDAIAILYLANNKNIDIKAISIVTTGEAHCNAALKNINGLLALADKKDIPIACGNNHPLVGNHRFPAWISQSADTLYGMAPLLPKQTPHPTLDAASLLKQTLSESKAAIDILALGPLTNIATVINKNPALKAKIRMIYIMGGAVDVPGNVNEFDKTRKNSKAEWNFYIDPKADEVVINSGIPITLVTLDVTNQVPVNDAFYQQLNGKPHTSKVSQFIYQLFNDHKTNFITQGWYFWDPLAAVISSDESFTTFKMEQIHIATKPESLAGGIIKDSRGKNIRVCSSVNASRATQQMLDTLMY